MPPPNTKYNAEQQLHQQQQQQQALAYARIPQQQQMQSPRHAQQLRKTITAGGSPLPLILPMPTSSSSPSSVSAYDYQKPPKYSSYLVRKEKKLVIQVIFMLFSSIKQSSYEQKSIPMAMNISMNPNYIEDLNGGDYVCMSGGSGSGSINGSHRLQFQPSQSNANQSSAVLVTYAQKALSTSIATSSPTATGTEKHISSIAPSEMQKKSTAVTATMVNDVIPSISPTPSQMSSGSGSGKRKTYISMSFYLCLYNINSIFNNNFR